MALRFPKSFQHNCFAEAPTHAAVERLLAVAMVANAFDVVHGGTASIQYGRDSSPTEMCRGKGDHPIFKLPDRAGLI